MLKVLEGEWVGLDGLGETLLTELRPEAEARVMGCVVLGSNELKLTLTGARTGRTYRVSRTGRLHTASAPGEPPAVLFGNLRNSVGFRPPVWEGWTVSGVFGVGLGTLPAGPEEQNPVTYARRLELGGTDSRGIYLAPRPYMEPTALRIEPRIDAILRGAG